MAWEGKENDFIAKKKAVGKNMVVDVKKVRGRLMEGIKNVERA